MVRPDGMLELRVNVRVIDRFFQLPLRPSTGTAALAAAAGTLLLLLVLRHYSKAGVFQHFDLPPYRIHVQKKYNLLGLQVAACPLRADNGCRPNT